MVSVRGSSAGEPAGIKPFATPQISKERRMRYECQIKKPPPFPAGIYPFRVATSVQTKSAKGNDMIMPTLVVTDEIGDCRRISDYFGAWNKKTMRAFLRATNLAHLLGTVVQAKDILHARGRCEIGINEEPGYFYGRAEIKRYMPAAKTGTPAATV